MNQRTRNAGSIIAGIASLTAAAVGAYYLYGHKDAAKHRAQVRSWMLKAKGDVLEELEKAQDVTESAYMGAVDAVARKYHELRNIDPDELAEFIREMKGHWNGIRRTIASRASSREGASRASLSRSSAGARSAQASGGKKRKAKGSSSRSSAK